MTVRGAKPQTTLTRREWQEFPIEAGGLSDLQADRLYGLATDAAKQLRLPESAVLLRTHRGLKAQQVAGILATPEITLEILPKIEGDDGSVRSTLIRMLAVAFNLRISNGELSSLQTQRLDLLELLIRLFCERLLEAVRQGLSRHYIEREEDLPVFRGSLLVKRQLTTHAARPDRLACRFDELSEDTPINRVFKATVSRLRRLTRTAENARRLDELSSRLEAVSISARPLAEPVQLDRTNAAFHSVYPMARLFLSGDWQSTTGGHSAGFALLFPMNELFEAYIGRLICRAAAPCSVRLQDRRHHALRHNLSDVGVFSLRPDAVVQAEVGPLIVDTKWKSLDPGEGPKFGVSQSDVYQMLAYAHAYGARRLILLYPWHDKLDGCGKHVSWRITGSESVLEAASVDICHANDVIVQLKAILCEYNLAEQINDPESLDGQQA